jgi:hypothetical protein
MATYDYRRDLKREDWMRIAGIGAAVGLGVGATAAYLARIFIQRTPLDDPRLVTPAQTTTLRATLEPPRPRP